MDEAIRAFTERVKLSVRADGRSVRGIADAAGVRHETLRQLVSDTPRDSRSARNGPTLRTTLALARALGQDPATWICGISAGSPLGQDEVAALRKILAALAKSGEAA